MEATIIDDGDGPVAALPSARYQQKLQALVAEIMRHERVKRERGKLDIEDRALHSRAQWIAHGRD